MIDLPPIPILNLPAWISAGAVFCVAYLVGAPMGRRLSVSRNFDGILIRLTAGLAALPVLVLIAGQLEGLLFIRVAWILPALAGAMLLGFHLLASFRSSAGSPPSAEADPASVDASPLLVLLGMLPLAAWMLYLLGPLSAPPINYDVLEYHLGVVPHAFEVGGVEPIPHVFYSAQPIATEMLYTLASVIEGTPWGGSAGFFQWMLLGFAALLLWRALEAAGLFRPLALLIPFAFLTHPILLRLSLDRMTDLTGAVFLLGGWLLWLGRDNESKGREPMTIFIVLGVLAGGAVSSKWTNAGTAALGIAMAPAIGLFLLRGEDAPAFFSSWLKAAALFILGGSLIMLPWMVWVAVKTGNPIAPFGAGLFPTERWGPENLHYLIETHHPLAVFGAEFWLRLFRRLLTPAIGTWPLFSAFALVLFARFRIRRVLDDKYFVISRNEPWNLLLSGAVAVAVALLLWGRLRHSADRFLAPVVAMEFLMLGGALALLLEHESERWMRMAVPAALIAFLAMALLGPMSPIAGAAIYWDHATGRMTSREFLSVGLGATTDFFDAANELPEGSRLIAVGEARRFYFRHPVTLASVFDRHPLAGFVEAADSTDQLRASLRRAGYTHLVVNEFETARLLDFHPPPVLEADPEFMELRDAKNAAALLERYAGMSEFGAHPLSEEDRGLYVRFLDEQKARTSYRSLEAPGLPAFWISPL